MVKIDLFNFIHLRGGWEFGVMLCIVGFSDFLEVGIGGATSAGECVLCWTYGSGGMVLVGSRRAACVQIGSIYSI